VRCLSPVIKNGRAFLSEPGFGMIEKDLQENLFNNLPNQLNPSNRGSDNNKCWL